MRVLHLGWGVLPFRYGGLIEYAEDLMQAQIENKLEVAYFFAGRYYPHILNPSLKIWKRRGVKMYEVINSVIYPPTENGTLFPEKDLHEPHCERLFRSVLREFKPDILHIQELASMPSSVIDIARIENIPILMTLQDYFPLCPTSKLITKDNLLCHKSLVGHECVSCCELASVKTSHLLRGTFYYDISILLEKFGLKLPAKKIKNFFKSSQKHLAVSTKVKPKQEKDYTLTSISSGQKTKKYQNRRDLNIERLNKVDLLVAQSYRVAQIYTEMGVRAENITTLNLTLENLSHIQPKLMRMPTDSVNFVTLNGCASHEKGAHLIMDALHILRHLGFTSRFKLFVLGNVMSSLKNEFMELENVVLLGTYERFNLEHLLEGIHVGIVSSVWEEAYGYVGVELLAKGIPVLGNNLGGIVDYTKEGFTGWINVSNTANELAKIMTDIIQNPVQILHLNRNIMEEHGTIVKSMDDHVKEMNKLYETLLA